MTEIAEQLSCQELVELVTDYLEGALPPAERARFESHIANCDGCSAYIEQIRVTIRLSGTLRPEQLDPAAEEALLEAFRDWKRRP
jgi:anti-sigma factor RsiW